MEKFLINFRDHLGEMNDGDVITIRRAEGKWVIISMSGAYTVVGSDENIDKAFSEER